MRVARRTVRTVALAALAIPVVPIITSVTTTTTGSLTRTVDVVRALGPGATQTVGVVLASRDRLVGVTWATGAANVTVRWHTHHGWTSWTALEDDSDVPNAAERAQSTPGTEPAWRPEGADRADVRVGAAEAVTALRVVVVGDVVRHTIGGVHLGSAEAATGTAALGHVYSRHDWGANESLRRCGPDYAHSNVAVVVHHTAQTNSYSASAVPSMIRADYTYHVQSRGWCDIGYNLLVDRFGRIWEGRYGGIGRAVIGAHAQGFNTGTVGVAFLGTTDSYAPSAAVQSAFAHVAVYAATTWHFDPASTVVMTSAGSPRYAAGHRVRLNRVMGHRDTGQTDCPGTYLYRDLAGIRAAAHAIIYAPRFTSLQITGTPLHAPKPADIWLGISRTAHWSIVLSDAHGNRLLAVAGTGTVAHMSWRGLRSIAGTPIALPLLPQNVHWVANAVVGRDHARPIGGGFAVGLPGVRG